MVLSTSLWLLAVPLLAPPSSFGAVSISGYVKLDVQYMDKVVGSGFPPGFGFPSSNPAFTPLDTNKEADNPQTILDARESRIAVNYTDDVLGLKLSGLVEADFFDDTNAGNALTSNSRHFRFRHAFARADHPAGWFLMAGQFWSIFMNNEVGRPLTVDFGGLAGQIFSRQPQIRAGWKMPLGSGMGNLLLEGGLEKQTVGGLLLAPGVQSNLGSPVVDERQGEGQTVPLFVGKVSWLHPIFQAEAAGAAGRNTVILTGGKEERGTSWGFQASAQALILPVRLVAHYQIQEGLGRLLNPAEFPDAGLTPANTLENIGSEGFYVGAGFFLSPETSINAVYGWARADEETSIGFTGGILEKHQSLHVNIIHKFWKNWQTGLEYKRFDVETFSGIEGDVNIILGALWYFF